MREKKGQWLSQLPWNRRVQYSLKRCKEGCKSDLQPGAMGKELAVLWAETTLEDRSIHENWQVPDQEILNATTRLERIRALGGCEAAIHTAGLRRTCLGWPVKFIRQDLGRMSSSWLNAGFKLFYASSSPQHSAPVQKLTFAYSAPRHNGRRSYLDYSAISLRLSHSPLRPISFQFCPFSRAPNFQ